MEILYKKCRATHGVTEINHYPKISKFLKNVKVVLTASSVDLPTLPYNQLPITTVQLRLLHFYLRQTLIRTQGNLASLITGHNRISKAFSTKKLSAPDYPQLLLAK